MAIHLATLCWQVIHIHVVFPLIVLWRLLGVGMCRAVAAKPFALVGLPSCRLWVLMRRHEVPIVRPPCRELVAVQRLRSLCSS